MRVALLIAIGLVLSACKADLYTNLPETEANEMLSVLLKRDIEADREIAADGSYTLRVEPDRMSEAIDALTALGYPRRTYRSMGEVFEGNGFILSPTEEKARLVYALSEELSRTISEIDGVVSSRVHVVLPTRNMLRRTSMPAAASVFLRHVPEARLDALTPQIKMLVANSVEGLTYDNVSVVSIAVRATEATNVAATGPALAPDATEPPRVAPGPAVSASVASGLAEHWRIALALLLAVYVVVVLRAFRRRNAPRLITQRTDRHVAH